MVKQFMRRHSLTDPMYAGLPQMPAHARPKLKLVGKSVAARRARNGAQSARPQRAPARRRTAEPGRSPHDDSQTDARGCCLLLWIAVLGSAVQVIYARHKARDLFVRLEKLNAERDSLEMEWGRLQLEQSYWSSHAFVERVANAKLQMTLPQTHDVRIVRP